MRCGFRALRRWGLAVLCTVGVGLAGESAGAITINLTYNPLGAPSSDPTGTDLTSIAQAAASIWEDIIEDPWTIDITLSYASLSGSTLAQGTMTATALGKPTDGYLNVDNGTTWWIDPTPLDSSEYNLVSTTYDQISAATQTNSYVGSVPSVMEYSYRGAGNTTATQNGQDLLSTVVHEMGHILGLSDPLASGEALIDFDYDVNPAFVGGQSMAIRTAGTDPGSVGSYGHIAALSLMCNACGASGTRRMPSATDVFAIASASNWALIDLPNKYLMGTGYNTASDWIGNRAPDLGNNVYVRNGDYNTMSANGSAGTLTVSDNTLLLTLGNQLNVAGSVTVAPGQSGTTAEIIVGSGGELQADSTLIDTNSEIDLAGGVLDTNDLTLNATGRLTGNGLVGLSGDFQNSGTIRPDGGTMTITNSVPDPSGMLIGSNGSTIDVTAGDLIVSAGSGPARLLGDMTVGAGHTAIFVNGLNSQTGSSVVLAGGSDAAGAARISGGGVFIIRGTVEASGRVELDTGVTIQNQRVTLTDPGTRFELGADSSDTVTILGAGNSHLVISGAGTVIQRGNLVAMPSGLNTEGLIQTTVYDMDGPGGANVNIQGGYTLEIDAYQIDESASDGYDGTATIEDGTLRINTHGIINLFGTPSDVAFPWRLDGTLVMDSDATLEGSTMQVQGTLTANGGNNFIDAPMTLLSTGTIDVPQDATLTLRGDATFEGGTITGFGTLAQQGDITVTANTTIATGGFDWGNSPALSPPHTITIDPGVTLNVNSLGTLDVDNKFRGHIVLNDGTLAVNTLYDWELPAVSGSFPVYQASGALYLNDAGRYTATVTGQDLTNNGLVSGVGLIDTNLTNGGDLMPGHQGDTGILNVSGYYIQQPGGTLYVELAGLTAGSGFDQLLIGGYASLPLGSFLDVSLIDGFVPSIGDSFRVLDTGGFTLGAFGQVMLPSVSGVGIGLVYDPNGLTLVAGLPGDLNGDGYVGLDDLQIVLGRWNTTTFAGVWSLGDPSGDGYVGLDDLQPVLDHWNEGTLPAVSAQTPIPEPWSAAGILTLLPVFINSRRRADA